MEENYMTSPEEIRQLVDDIIASNVPKNTDCSFEVEVGEDLIPIVIVNVPDEDIDVFVETDELTEGEQLIGYEFTPVVRNNECEFHLDYHEGSGAARFKYEVWASIATYCEAIAETEIIFSNYM